MTCNFSGLLCQFPRPDWLEGIPLTNFDQRLKALRDARHGHPVLAGGPTTSQVTFLQEDRHYFCGNTRLDLCKGESSLATGHDVENPPFWQSVNCRSTTSHGVTLRSEGDSASNAPKQGSGIPSLMILLHSSKSLGHQQRATLKPSGYHLVEKSHQSKSRWDTDPELPSSATPKLNEPWPEGQPRLSLVPSSAILSSAPGRPVQGTREGCIPEQPGWKNSKYWASIEKRNQIITKNYWK